MDKSFGCCIYFLMPSPMRNRTQAMTLACFRWNCYHWIWQWEVVNCLHSGKVAVICQGIAYDMAKKSRASLRRLLALISRLWGYLAQLIAYLSTSYCISCLLGVSRGMSVCRLVYRYGATLCHYLAWTFWGTCGLICQKVHQNSLQHLRLQRRNLAYHLFGLSTSLRELLPFAETLWGATLPLKEEGVSVFWVFWFVSLG